MERDNSSLLTLNSSLGSDIDLVIPMVFPHDGEWLAAYQRAKGVNAGIVSNVRFRSWGTEDMLIQCCRKYMPWLRRIHILLASESQAVYLTNGTYQTNGAHVPEIRLVYHRDFIPGHLLPCFNVNTIEMFLHRIPGLSEYFIYSNDDLFPLSPLKVSDFFQERAGRLLPCQHMEERAYPSAPNIFHRFVMSGLNMVAADFGKKFKRTWLKGGHSMTPMLRSTVEKVCTLHADRISRSFTFARTDKNFNQYIFPFYQYLSGEYVDHVPKRRYVGKGTPTAQLPSIIRDPDAGIVCLNDNESITDWEKRAALVRCEIGMKLETS